MNNLELSGNASYDPYRFSAAIFTFSKEIGDFFFSCSHNTPITSDKSNLYCLPAISFIASRYSPVTVLIVTILENVR
ncbi:MAG: hypothetical protein IIY78_08475 [Clostridia bacterium]|nr:hypothetical protein [Clostridia bacterium]